MQNQQNNNALMGPPGKVKITAAAFASKYKSKREVYNFLAVDVGIYLPSFGTCPKTAFLTLCFHHIEQVTIYFLKDLACGKKKSKCHNLVLLTHNPPIEILSWKVRHVSVPFYESLSLEKIKEFCRRQPNDIDRYFPDKQELHKISREWVCNVIATVLEEVFTDWVGERIKTRNEEVTDKKEMNIELDQDIADAFNMSTSVSREFRFYFVSYLFFLL